MNTATTIYTAQQAASRTGRTARRIRAIATARNLGIKIGRDWLFLDSDLAEFAKIDPRGGRPRWDGETPHYKVTREEALERKRHPRRRVRSAESVPTPAGEPPHDGQEPLPDALRASSGVS